MQSKALKIAVFGGIAIGLLSAAEYLIFQKGIISIPYKNGYRFKRFKNHIPKHVINEIQTISKATIDTVMKYPIFQGQNSENKIVTVLYESQTMKPVGLHIGFYFDITDDKNATKKVLHTGLILISKEHQQNGLQQIVEPVSVLFWIENLFKSFYVTDIGQSPSGLRKFNAGAPNGCSYPNPTMTEQETETLMTKYGDIFKKICDKMLKDYRNEFGCSEIATFDPKTFVVKNSNDKQGGGAWYLLPHTKSQKSRNQDYNNFIENNCGPYDEIMVVVYLDSFQWIKHILSSELLK